MTLYRLNKRYTQFVYFFKYIFYKYILQRSICVFSPWVRISWGKVVPHNFGDDVNMYFLTKVSYDCLLPRSAFFLQNKEINFFWHKNKPIVYTIGSILHLIQQKNVIVWGSGMLSEDYPPSIHLTDIRAVRGPLTRECLLQQGMECPPVYGDPAMLLPFYYQPRKMNKKYRLGIIPHYVDQNKSEVIQLQADDTIIIDLVNYKKWTDVIDQINSCEFIASSSLHGLIIAESYNIPNLWVEFGEPIVGDKKRRFKFHDYFLSIGLDRDNPYVIENGMSSYDVYYQMMFYRKAPGLSLKPLVECCPFTLQKSFIDKII